MIYISCETELGTDHLTLWLFVSFRKKISDNTRVKKKKLCRAKREICFQILTLDYITKTLNQIFFFSPPPKSEYFFQQHWESEYFFLVKKHNPLPTPFKLNGRSLKKAERY